MNFPVGWPRLSIVINNYNYAQYLPEALGSVIRQMIEGDELIVVDDGSTDGSSALLQEFARDYGIRLIEQANCGQMGTVRAGIKAAQGDVVVLLDSDDYFLDGYLQRLRDIYKQHPDVSFVFANAQIGGESITGRENMRGLFHRLELPAGKIGTTKWATLLFYEFVGLPTSGLSLHRSLANDIIALPGDVDEVIAIPPLHSKLLSISKTEQAKSRITADGVIVRCASIFGAQKYYDDRPGFLYRIHGDNKYATTSRLGRWYLLRLRKKQFRRLFTEHSAIAEKPTAIELRQEILGRAFGRRLARRITVRGNYCRAVFTCKGSVGEKCAALSAALGLVRREG
jgi:glycosyltransferase involved in cell wall biosynthesis